ncbi:uncharacterized protein LOC121382293 [Gigantopelta aegis]|uniref:uncharacterized protein LOC121382293 n=1 Tax=Gigantopelta aegis TaxID=1735272 RepID=UPI001B88BAA5|nr:uncharacterized protein LOC121382293 [Gigantopelta aegis]
MYLRETATLLSFAVMASAFFPPKQLCTLQNCGNFRYSNIAVFYRGLFKTKDQIVREDLKWAVDHQRRYGKTLLTFWEVIFQASYVGGHDFDQCCPTTMSHINPTTLTNTNGIVRVIVHLDLLTPSQFQWIPHGECSSAPHFCVGVCRLENITMYLLVHNFALNPPFEFDSFSVPSYCSCKSS